MSHPLKMANQEEERKHKSYQCLQIHSKVGTVSVGSKSQLPKQKHTKGTIGRGTMMQITRNLS